MITQGAIGRRGLPVLLLAIPWAVGLGGCDRTATNAPDKPPWFEPAGESSGLAFRHDSGHRERILFPEISCGGAALFDADGDGDLDAYLVQAGQITDAAHERPPNRLYLNRGDGTFEDVTESSGAGDRGYGMGVTTGDYDNDGRPDLYVTNIGPNVLLRNKGGGRFEDVTEVAGVGHADWGSSCAFLDYDADGDLDLFVVNYIHWSIGSERECFTPAGARDYCNPNTYRAPARDVLYRNDGDGTFTDVSEAAGLADAFGNGLGVICGDFSGDGRPDVFVANDGMVNQLWENLGDGRFRDTALLRGCAMDADGIAKAGMGVAAEDVDDDRDLDLLVVNLHNESDSFYRNAGGYFTDDTVGTGLATMSRPFTRFGVGLCDFDNDGILDLYEANGRVRRQTSDLGSDPFAEPNILARGTPSGRFEEVKPRGGTNPPLIATSRGAAFGDINDDGGIDVLVVNRDGPAHLLLNAVPNRGNWIRFRVLDEHGRDAIGAVVEMRLGARRLLRDVRSASSYCSANDPRVQVGLGTATEVRDVVVRWPDGEREGFGDFAAGATATLSRSRPAPGTQRMTERLERLAAEMDPMLNPYANDRRVEVLRERLEQTRDPRQQLDTLTDLAKELLYAGFTDESLERLWELRELSRTYPRLVRRDFDQRIREFRGLAHLRRGEQDNCIAMHSIDSCLLPIQASGIHTNTRGARRAIELFEDVLAKNPNDLRTRWLLNVAYSTLGEHPQEVRPAWIINFNALESDQTIERFPDVAMARGVSVLGRAGGAVMDDLDGDGDLDIMCSAWGIRDQIRLFVNEGDGPFVDRTKSAGLTGLVGGINLVQADYDNDGDLDVFVLRGAWLLGQGAHPNSLLRNNGDGRFEDVTEEAGLLSFHPTQTAAWADYDGDGWLDLFVGNESAPPKGVSGGWAEFLERGDPALVHPCELFHNNGDGTFTECAAANGVAAVGFTKGVTFGDYDIDGRPDLYISRFGQPNLLYRNEGPGAAPGTWSFCNVAAEAGVAQPVWSFPTWFFDYDNDGHPDLFVAGYRTRDVGDVARDYLGLKAPGEPPRLYRNRGDGRFDDVTAKAGLETVTLPMGANFGDLDNDGWLDFYLATGDPSFRTVIPNRMFRNDAGVFKDVTISGGFGHLQKGHAVAFGDLDGDGDQDLYCVIGGAFTGDIGHNTLFENPGSGNRWITLRLEGVKSNRCAIGARIRVEFTQGGRTRSVWRTVGSGGSFGASSLQQEIGLGAAEGTVRVEIHWPGGGAPQIFDGLSPDRVYRLREGDVTTQR